MCWYPQKALIEEQRLEWVSRPPRSAFLVFPAKMLTTERLFPE